jgi:membrane protease YdiL (CAAX protease family)
MQASNAMPFASTNSDSDVQRGNPATSNLKAPGKPKPIDSWGHFIGYLGILVGLVAWGAYTQHAGVGKPGTAAPGQLGSHSAALQFYFISMIGDWALFYYCFAGVRKNGGTLATLTGGRWLSWKQVAVDLAIAIPFWVIWEGVAYGVSHLLGPREAKSVAALLPQTALEVVIWMFVCITAGFTEEVQSRGYLQQQFHALFGNISMAVLAQGLVFGLMHSYQGWQAVLVIAVLGVLYGAMAAWRRNLRVVMIAHAWSDVWEGWLKFLIWR